MVVRVVTNSAMPSLAGPYCVCGHSIGPCHATGLTRRRRGSAPCGRRLISQSS